MLSRMEKVILINKSFDDAFRQFCTISEHNVREIKRAISLIAAIKSEHFQAHTRLFEHINEYGHDDNALKDSVDKRMAIRKTIDNVRSKKESVSYTCHEAMFHVDRILYYMREIRRYCKQCDWVVVIKCPDIQDFNEFCEEIGAYHQDYLPYFIVGLDWDGNTDHAASLVISGGLDVIDMPSIRNIDCTHQIYPKSIALSMTDEITAYVNSFRTRLGENFLKIDV